MDKQRINLRIWVVALVFAGGFFLIGARAFYLQVIKGDWLRWKAEKQYEQSLVSRGKRGVIYDANMKEMAVSLEVSSVAAYPPQIRDKKTTAALISQALKLNPLTVFGKLRSKRDFVWIKRQVGPAEARAIRSLELEGVGFIPEYSRFYPNRTLAAQVLGFTGIDGHGLEGLEFYYDQQLQGRACKFKVLTDALNRRFYSEKPLAPDPSGNNLVLTLDRTIQFITEKALREAALNFRARSGIAIVMDPHTGAVLAMAHYPFFNPNAFGKYDRNLWRNRAITDPFEPGSTMKIFSAAAAIESGLCTPETIFFCENGQYRVGGDIVHDTRAHGWLPLRKIIKFSSNIGAVKISEMIGEKNLYQTLRRFGFGEKTGIDCPAETAGTLSPYENWSRIDAGAISFGQGISVSAIQLVRAVAAIANGGKLMRPYIVRAILDRQGQVVKQFGPQVLRQAVSAETARTIKEMMRAVVAEGGTGVNAALEGYSVCGKTGTAQKVDTDGTYAEEKYLASFVGLTPSRDPQLSIVVIIDEPRSEHYGGVVAAPAFRRIAHESLNYLNILPDESGDHLTASRQGAPPG